MSLPLIRRSPVPLSSQSPCNAGDAGNGQFFNKTSFNLHKPCGVSVSLNLALSRG